MPAARIALLFGLFAILMAGCAAPARGCYVGLSLIPPAPIVVCGLDFDAGKGKE